AVYFLPPPPFDFIVLLAPPPPIGLFVLPIPVFVPIPLWCNHPAYLVAPPGNVIFNNIHNTVIINNVTNTAIIKNQNGQTISSKPAFAQAGHSLGTPLPPTMAKAALSQPPGAGVASTTPVQQSSKLPSGQRFPGMNDHALPQAHGKSAPGAGAASTTPVQQSSKLPPEQRLNYHALPQAHGKSGSAGPPTGSTAAAQKFQSPAHSSASASRVAHPTAAPAQIRHSPGPASTFHPAAAGPVRSF